MYVDINLAFVLSLDYFDIDITELQKSQRWILTCNCGVRGQYGNNLPPTGAEKALCPRWYSLALTTDFKILC